jgi:pimeloyl-ACP methyl ester carboxylesterase
MIHRLFFALLLCAAAPALAADAASVAQAPNRFAATIVPAERFELGATLVERHGQRGTPLIFLPGLASGAWTWQAAVRQFAGQHTVYVLTFPGFDGRPAREGGALAAAQQSVLELIASRQLKRPVLIGHALGGTMALALAAQHAHLVGGVVSIDGLPVMPGTEEWNPAQRGAMTGAITGQVMAPTPTMFAAQQQQYMRGTGVIDMARADELARLTARSDPQAVARFMAEAISLDLRSMLPAIKAPVLVLSPYFLLDAEQLRQTEEAKTAYYRTLMQGTPNVTVISVGPARHFAMFDQPEQVNTAIAQFLKLLR